jgi:hypothetical protein
MTIGQLNSHWKEILHFSNNRQCKVPSPTSTERHKSIRVMLKLIADYEIPSINSTPLSRTRPGTCYIYKGKCEVCVSEVVIFATQSTKFDNRNTRNVIFNFCFTSCFSFAYFTKISISHFIIAVSRYLIRG